MFVTMLNVRADELGGCGEVVLGELLIRRRERTDLLLREGQLVREAGVGQPSNDLLLDDVRRVRLAYDAARASDGEVSGYPRCLLVDVQLDTRIVGDLDGDVTDFGIFGLANVQQFLVLLRLSGNTSPQQMIDIRY